VECHDQAIVGGQTAIFRLADAAMYDSMHTGSQNMMIDRAVALHKMARLATAAAAGNGYLNFMGNEFGHPEWIDFPREGNNWSYDHARRQWSLADNDGLRFKGLNEFDRAMMQIFSTPGFYDARVQHLKVDDAAKIIAFERNDYYFIFNFHPHRSVSDYPLEVRPFAFETVLDSDAIEFGGFGLRTPDQKYFAIQQSSGTFIKLYLPSRSALVLKRT
jgi:1,4-alpha-glucan branching enzyme